MPINILDAFEKEPPQLDFISPGFLAGTVGALVSPGATGKSYLALEAAMAIACNVPGGDIIGFNPEKTGRVAYFAGEDPEPALIIRLHAIGKYLNPEARAAIATNLLVESIAGKRMNIMDEKHLARIIEYCTGTRLIILDTLSRIHQLNENDNGEMSQLISTLEYVAKQTGAAILYLHHVSKSSATSGQGDQQQSARGASALIDNARWCSNLSKMTDKEAQSLSDNPSSLNPIGENRRGYFVRFVVSKQNYGSPQPDKWFQRHEGGVLLPVELYSIKDQKGTQSVTSSKKKAGKNEATY